MDRRTVGDCLGDQYTTFRYWFQLCI